MTQKIPVIDQNVPNSDQVAASKKPVDENGKPFDDLFTPVTDEAKLDASVKKVKPHNLFRTPRTDKDGKKVVLKAKPILDRSKIKITPEEMALAEVSKKIKEDQKQAGPEIKVRAISEEKLVSADVIGRENRAEKHQIPPEDIKLDTKLDIQKSGPEMDPQAENMVASIDVIPAIQTQDLDPVVKTSANDAILPHVSKLQKLEQAEGLPIIPKKNVMSPKTENPVVQGKTGVDFSQSAEKIKAIVDEEAVKQDLTPSSQDRKPRPSLNIDQPPIDAKNNGAKVQQDAKPAFESNSQNSSKQTVKRTEAELAPIKELPRKNTLDQAIDKRDLTPGKTTANNLEKQVSPGKLVDPKIEDIPKEPIAQKPVDETILTKSGSSPQNEAGVAKRTLSPQGASKTSRQAENYISELRTSSKELGTQTQKLVSPMEKSEPSTLAEAQIKRDLNIQAAKSSEQIATAPEQLSINLRSSDLPQVAQTSQNTLAKPKLKTTVDRDVKAPRTVAPTKSGPSRRAEMLRENYGIEPVKAQSTEPIEENPADILKQQLRDRIEVLKKAQDSINAGSEQKGNQNLHRNLSMRVNPVTGMVPDQSNSMAHVRTQSALFARSFASEMVDKIREVVNNQPAGANGLHAKFIVDGGNIGQMDVEFHQESSKDQITIFVDNENAKNDLNRILPQIEDNLHQRGFNLGQVDVEVRDNQERNGSAANRDRGHSNPSVDNPSSSDQGVSDDNLVIKNRNYGYNTMEVLA